MKSFSRHAIISERKSCHCAISYSRIRTVRSVTLRLNSSSKQRGCMDKSLLEDCSRLRCSNSVNCHPLLEDLSKLHLSPLWRLRFLLDSLSFVTSAPLRIVHCCTLVPPRISRMCFNYYYCSSIGDLLCAQKRWQSHRQRCRSHRFAQHFLTLYPHVCKFQIAKAYCSY